MSGKAALLFKVRKIYAKGGNGDLCRNTPFISKRGDFEQKSSANDRKA
jgi:hypothetical protein